MKERFVSLSALGLFAFHLNVSILYCVVVQYVYSSFPLFEKKEVCSYIEEM